MAIAAQPVPSACPSIANDELVPPSSFQAMEDFTRNLVGNFAWALLGSPDSQATASANQLTCAPVSGMQVSVTSSGGLLLIDSQNGPRLCDTLPNYTVTLASADATNPRYDLICANYAQALVTNGTLPFINTNTETAAPATVYNATESVTWSRVTGTPAASPVYPVPTANSVAVFAIFVAANATSIVPQWIIPLLQPMVSTLLANVGSFVDLTSNQTIGGSKTFTSPLSVGGSLYADGHINFGGATALTVNSNLTEILANDTGTNGGILFGNQTSASVFGTITSAGYAISGATYGQSALIPNGFVHAGPSNTGFGSIGDMIAERGGPSGVVYLGNTGRSYLFFDGASYRMPGGSLILDSTAFLDAFGVILGTPNTAGPNAIIFGSPTASGTHQTTIGSSTVTTTSVTATLMGIGVYQGAQLLALDDAGNVGIIGNLHLAASTGIVFGNQINLGTIGAANQEAILFGNSSGAGVQNTSIGASALTVSGITGSIFGVSNNYGSSIILGLDAAGNLGVLNSVHANGVTLTSARKKKRNIIAHDLDALAIVRDTHVMRWNYSSDPEDESPRYGPIAEDAHSSIVNSERSGVRLEQMNAVLWAAVQQLSDKVARLESAA